ncbi:MAG: NUDIX hydrolase [Anaerolineae bacterium]|nr:NUDIX hydrolase [Anaerolineae bacterium]MDW8173318.1 NUDIX hydrolase [Anaerolineae bacterium]
MTNIISGLQRQFRRFIKRFPWLIRGAYYVYRRFQRRYSVGVVGVLWNERGEVLLVEHVFHPQIPWGLPGGWIGADEDPSYAVCRELKEELGLDVEVIRVVLVDKTHPWHLDMAFDCRTASPVSNLSYELTDYRWTKPQELPRLHKFHYDAIMLSCPPGEA